VSVPLPGERLGADQVPDLVRRFEEAHHRQYGHSMGDPVEIVALRLRAVGVLQRPSLPRIERGNGDASGALLGRRAVYRGDSDGHADYAVYARARLRAGDRLAGPAIVEEPSSTTIIHPGDELTVGDYGELVVNTS